ncbi:MAG: hypothetical protein U0V48_03585 [Anaerolineales bacterium]
MNVSCKSKKGWIAAAGRKVEVIRDKLAIELQKALAGADVLIAHNVAR